jgi:hypothetical protein
MAHANEVPKPLREVNPSVAASPELEALLFRALEKDRNKRFATAREFARALEEILPLLSETAGAPPPLPLDSEVTGDPTRVAVRGDAVTVQTAPPARTLVTPPPVMTTPSLPAPHEERGEGTKLAVIAVILVAIIGAAAWLLWPKSKTDVVTTTKPPVTQTQTIATALVPIQINAWPWANVTSIRNVDNGQSIELGGPLVTPAPYDLPPGKYEITFSNPAFPNTITRTIDVATGRPASLHVQFRAPTMPDFGGKR